MFQTGCTYFKCMYNKVFKSALKFPSDKQVKIIFKKMNNMTIWNGIDKIMCGRNEYLWNILINEDVIKYMDCFVWEYICVCVHICTEAYPFISCF